MGALKFGQRPWVLGGHVLLTDERLGYLSLNKCASCGTSAMMVLLHAQAVEWVMFKKNACTRISWSGNSCFTTRYHSDGSCDWCDHSLIQEDPLANIFSDKSSVGALASHLGTQIHNHKPLLPNELICMDMETRLSCAQIAGAGQKITIMPLTMDIQDVLIWWNERTDGLSLHKCQQQHFTTPSRTCRWRYEQGGRWRVELCITICMYIKIYIRNTRLVWFKWIWKISRLFRWGGWDTVSLIPRIFFFAWYTGFEGNPVRW